MFFFFMYNIILFFFFPIINKKTLVKIIQKKNLIQKFFLNDNKNIYVEREKLINDFFFNIYSGKIFFL